MKTWAAVAAGAALVAGAQAQRLEVCSDTLNDFGIKDVSLPENIAAGERFSVEVTQVPNKYVNKGHVRVEVDVEGVKVHTEFFELCSVVPCHVEPHRTSTAKFDLTLPEDVPAGLGTTMKIIVNDHNGALLSCVDVQGVPVSKTKNDGSLRVSAGRGLSLSVRELEFLFERWVHEYGIDIAAEEAIDRMKTFADNLEQIAIHNARGEESFTLGLNQFAHLTAEEFANTYLGYRGGDNQPSVNRTFYSLDVEHLGLTDIPDEIDWTEKGAVTPVKNQGSCGSCWAFSTTGALEGAYYLKTGELVSFSEQELVSCDHVDQGCNGGLMDNADRFIMKAGGLCTEEDYPYTSGRGGHSSCTKCSKVEGSAPTDVVDVAHNEPALEAAVAKRPVSVAIEADQLAFQFYRRGVLTGNCGRMLDHGVLVVGYGDLDGTKYWKVKNSWGPSYGLSGYILIQRGKHVRGGECGVLLSASYPVM